MWNRIKAYYTENISGLLHLHHYTPGKYSATKLDSSYVRSKKFLSMLGREYGYRKPYYEFVLPYNNVGYISNRTRNITLEEEYVMGAYNPVPNRFYEDSYFSTYVESNCTQRDLIHITEKTFEPLIKGHAILPFTNPGAVQRLQNMGFKLVDFVDYGFDTVTDADERFKLVQTEFLKLLEIDLFDSYQQNLEVFKHNQACINAIPYDNRILEIFNV
jgi:hypothetical protein